MRFKETARKTVAAVAQSVENIGFRPYLPRKSTLNGLTTFYSVLSGIFFAEAYTEFGQQGLLGRLEFEPLIAVGLTFLVSALLLVMVWIEIESNIQNQDLEENQDHVDEKERPAISYVRTVAALLSMFTFSVAPAQLAMLSNSLVAFIRAGAGTSKLDSILAYFYIYVTFALSVFVMWRVVLLVTSGHPKKARGIISAKLIKNGLQIPLAVYLAYQYAFVGASTLVAKGFIEMIILPFVLMTCWFGAVWILVERVESARLSRWKGIAIALTLMVVVLLIYASIFQ